MPIWKIKKLYRQCLHQTTLFHNASVTWQEMFWNNYCLAYKPVNYVRYSWMSQQADGLWWSRCVGICTNGAKTMTERHSGVVTRVQVVAPNATWVQCLIHRKALAAKWMPDSLEDILDTTVKMVNFVKARPLNSRVFSAPCNIGSNHVTLLQHTEVRWLLRGKVFTNFLELRDQLKGLYWL